MKLDNNKDLTNGARRTLKSLKTAFITLLTKKSFDELKIQDLSKESMIPRSTFYNYFDDKYDLLTWFLSDTSEMEYDDLESFDDIFKLINTFFDVIDSYKNLIDKILVKNPKTSFFYHSFIDNIEAAAVRRISPLQSNIKSEMPIDLIARWYARSVILIFEYVYVDHNKCTRKEMFDYIRKFIS